MNTLIGPLPKHQYVWVDTNFTHRDPVGFIPAVWFGLVSHPGRMWGCNIIYENGAIYRNVPLHALAHLGSPTGSVRDWTPQQAEQWNCYGYGWSATEYTYLRGYRCKAKCGGEDLTGTYLFTVAPVGDGFSETSEQSKEFTFVKLDCGRFTVQPTDRLIFEDKSFTTHQWEWPKVFKRQTETYSCE
jgi:hypothetical protein